MLLIAKEQCEIAKECSTKYLSDEGYGSIESTKNEHSPSKNGNMSPAWLHCQNPEHFKDMNEEQEEEAVNTA